LELVNPRAEICVSVPEEVLLHFRWALELNKISDLEIGWRREKDLTLLVFDNTVAEALRRLYNEMVAAADSSKDVQALIQDEKLCAKAIENASYAVRDNSRPGPQVFIDHLVTLTEISLHLGRVMLTIADPKSLTTHSVGADGVVSTIVESERYRRASDSQS